MLSLTVKQLLHTLEYENRTNYKSFNFKKFTNKKK